MISNSVTLLRSYTTPQSPISPETPSQYRRYSARSPTSWHRASMSPHRASTSPHRASTSPHQASKSSHRAPTSPHRAPISSHRMTSPRSPTSLPQMQTSPHRAPTSRHRMTSVRVFHGVSQCFKCFMMFTSGSRYFTMYHYVLHVFHDVLLCFMMFSESRNDRRPPQ